MIICLPTIKVLVFLLFICSSFLIGNWKFLHYGATLMVCFQHYLPVWKLSQIIRSYRIFRKPNLLKEIVLIRTIVAALLCVYILTLMNIPKGLRFNLQWVDNHLVFLTLTSLYLQINLSSWCHECLYKKKSVEKWKENKNNNKFGFCWLGELSKWSVTK